MTRNSLIGLLLVFMGALLWSTAGLFIRVTETDIPTTLFWRSLVGGFAVMLPYMILTKQYNIKSALRVNKGELIIALFSAAGMLCFISAFFYTTIGNVLFIYGLMPLLTYLFSILILKEVASRMGLTCSLISMAGVMVMVWGAQNLTDGLGFLLAFGMTIFMALYTIAVKLYPQSDMYKAVYISSFFCAIIVLPFADVFSPSVIDYYWLITFGIVGAAMGLGFYTLGVQRVTAVTAALIGLTEIPLAPIWGWWLFDEYIAVQTIIGGIMILASVIVYLLWQKNPNSHTNSVIKANSGVNDETIL